MSASQPLQRTWDDYHVQAALQHLIRHEDGRLEHYRTRQLPDGSMFCRCKSFAYRGVCRHIDFYFFRSVVLASAELRDLASHNGGIEAMLDGVRRAIAGNPGAAKSLRVSIMLVAAAQGAVSASTLRDTIPLERILPPGTNRNVVGATFNALAQEGLIEPVGREMHRSPSAHARSVTKWMLTPKGRNLLALSPQRLDESDEPLEVRARQ